MKKWFAGGIIFLLTYVVFLVATLPAQVALGYVTLPQGINIQGVSGTIWQTKIAQLQTAKVNIKNIQAALNFGSIVMLNPKVAITFGDPLLSGPEGKFTISGTSELLTITNAKIIVSANTIAKQLALPLPVTASGNVQLNLAEISLEKLSAQHISCQQAQGDISWSKAQVNAMNNRISLGDFTAKIQCKNKQLTAELSPKNDLGLVAKVNILKNGRAKVDGYLKPSVKFPKALKSALPFMGKPDNQGRYRLSL